MCCHLLKLKRVINAANYLQGFMAEHLTVCGGHLSAEDTPTQLFSHAKFGDVNYDNKEDCDWIIEAPEGKNVHLNFVNFELEDEQDCGYDFIEVSLLKFEPKTKRGKYEVEGEKAGQLNNVLPGTKFFLIKVE